MQMTLPRKMRIWYTDTVTDADGNKYVVAAAFYGEKQDVNVPRFLRDTKGWDNDVVHAKPITLKLHPNKSYVVNQSVGPFYYFKHDKKGNCVGGWVKGAKASEDSIEYYSNSISTAGARKPYVCTTEHYFVRRTTREYKRYISYERDRLGPTNYRWEIPVAYPAEWQVKEWLDETIAPPFSVEYTSSYGKSTSEIAVSEYPFPVARAYFHFREPDWVFNPLADIPEVIQKMQGRAFSAAYEQFPRYADNNLSNMKDTLGMAKDILSGDVFDAARKSISSFGDLVKSVGASVSRTPGGGFHFSNCSKKAAKKCADSLSNAWLSYRYCYSTTKSDVRQALDATSRSAITYLRGSRYDGNVDYDTGYANVQVHCEFLVYLDSSNMLGMLNHYAWLRGVNLSLFKAWDFVPFSFMVDWFADIGGDLETMEAEDMLGNYIFDKMLYSIMYQSEIDHIYQCYTRWYSDYIPEHLFRESCPSSENTWLKRGADSSAIIETRLDLKGVNYG